MRRFLFLCEAQDSSGAPGTMDTALGGYGPPTYHQHLLADLDAAHQLLRDSEDRVHRARMRWRWSRTVHKALVLSFLGARLV